MVPYRWVVSKLHEIQESATQIPSSSVLTPTQEPTCAALISIHVCMQDATSWHPWTPQHPHCLPHMHAHCHELWLWNLGGTWPWEGHITKPGLTCHVTSHMTSHMIRHLSLYLTSHVTRNENMTWCTLTSADVLSVMSTTDTRAQQTTKSSEIGPALTPTRVNATQS